MTIVYVYKINLKKSKIPKTLKLPKYVYPKYPIDKKPSPFLNPTIDTKKAEFLLKMNKGKEYYSFQQLDPFPQIWTRGVANLFRNNEYKDLFQSEEEDALFLETQTYNVSKLTYDETDRSLTNSTIHYAGKKGKKLKSYGETFVHFDLIDEKKTDDILDLLPTKFANKLTKDYLDKSLKILEKKSTKPKDPFGKLLYQNQQIFNSYEKYDLAVLAKRLNVYKYSLLNDDDPSGYLILFFDTLDEFINIYCKILNIKNSLEAVTPIFSHLTYNKDKEKHNKDYNILRDHLIRNSKD